MIDFAIASDRKRLLTRLGHPAVSMLILDPPLCVQHDDSRNELCRNDVLCCQPALPSLTQQVDHENLTGHREQAAFVVQFRPVISSSSGRPPLRSGRSIVQYPQAGVPHTHSAELITNACFVRRSCIDLMSDYSEAHPQ